jgi:hypothetical protein
MGDATTEPTIIFLHIGKTGGLSFRYVLRKQFPASRVFELKTRGPGPARMRREATASYFATLPEEERLRPRLIVGHTTFGIHELIPRPSTYITLLREPVALVASLYHYIRRTPKHALYDEVARSGISFGEFVTSGLSLETDNSQTRAISGDTTTDWGRCTDEMLEQAKANIDERFSAVGLTERFDESLLLLRRAFGWSNLYYVKVNVAGARREPLAPETLETIRRQNRLDLELYRWAGERMDRAIAADARFADDLRRFHQRNRMYRPWGHLTYTYPKRIRDRLRPPAGVDR